LKAVLEAVPQGAVIVDSADEVLFANRLARRLVGDTLEVGRAPWARSVKGVVECRTGGELRMERFALQELGGLELVILSAAEPDQAPPGAGQPSAERLNEIEAIAQLGSWSWDVRDDRLWWSDGLCRLYGVPANARPTTFGSFTAITPPQIRDAVVTTIERCRETGEGYALMTRIADGGRTSQWRYSRASTAIADGRVVRMFGTTQDITERMMTEEVLGETLEQAQRLAEENDALRAELEAQLCEVSASRSRIVQATDTARRRLEHDLRDGAHRRLTAVGSILRDALAQLDSKSDPELARTLASAERELETGLDELQALARGLHPAVLTDRGLVAAVSALAARCPVTVKLRAESVGTLPAAVESTAYFVVAEALTNVAKHAGASQALVALEQHATSLVIEVTDDGVGGATVGAGSGLPGLSDRVAALGGHLRMHGPAAGGTTLHAELPVRDPVT
jgi:signal transduction histidine kinase